jgi:hypothetical protein
MKQDINNMIYGQRKGILEAELKSLHIILKLAKDKVTRDDANDLLVCLAILHDTQNFDYIDINEYVLFLDDLEKSREERRPNYGTARETNPTI